MESTWTRETMKGQVVTSRKMEGEALEIEGIFLKDISDEPTKGPPRERINSKHHNTKDSSPVMLPASQNFPTPFLSCPLFSQSQKQELLSKQGERSNSSPSLQQALAGSRDGV